MSLLTTSPNFEGLAVRGGRHQPLEGMIEPSIQELVSAKGPET